MGRTELIKDYQKELLIRKRNFITKREVQNAVNDKEWEMLDLMQGMLDKLDNESEVD